MFFKGMFKSKTFWAAIAQFLVAVVAWATGKIDLWVLILDFVAMLGVIFYRSSIDQNLRSFFNKFDFFKSKTFWAGISAALALVITWLSGEIEFAPMLLGVISAMVGIFLRSAQAPE